MPRTFTRRLAVALALLAAFILIPAQCGIIFHVDRWGQPTGQVDWCFFGLDCCWFLVCFFPGVAALVIDYLTGGLFLPSSGQAPPAPTPAPPPPLTSRPGG